MMVVMTVVVVMMMVVMVMVILGHDQRPFIGGSIRARPLVLHS